MLIRHADSNHPLEIDHNPRTAASSTTTAEELESLKMATPARSGGSRINKRPLETAGALTSPAPHAPPVKRQDIKKKEHQSPVKDGPAHMKDITKAGKPNSEQLSLCSSCTDRKTFAGVTFDALEQLYTKLDDLLTAFETDDLPNYLQSMDKQERWERKITSSLRQAEEIQNTGDGSASP